jgi:inner membrane protein
MSPVTHLLVSWLVAESAPLQRRERALVALAGIAPDLDGLGIVPELLTRGSEHPLPWFSMYHHVLLHNVVGTVVIAAAVALFTRGTWRWRLGVGALAASTFVLHIICDLLGARGPDGFQWPVTYWSPFSDQAWLWSGQWRLDSWQNLVITLFALLITLFLAWRRGRSPIEIVSLRADAAVVGALHRRFPRKVS